MIGTVGLAGGHVGPPLQIKIKRFDPPLQFFSYVLPLLLTAARTVTTKLRKARDNSYATPDPPLQKFYQ